MILYILPKCYSLESKSETSCKTMVLLIPSCPKKEINRFKQLIIETINNKKNIWNLIILNSSLKDRSPQTNYSLIYSSDVVIAECTEKKPNIFYLIGLAHAFGKPVCSCYRVRNGQNADIPFNVHGRQSLNYSLSTVKQQKIFQNDLKEWIKRYE